MILDASFFYWIFDNYILLIQFIIFVLIPILLISFILQRIVDKIRKVRRINGIVISAYNYNSFKQHASGLNESVKKRIETVLNTYYKVNNRYWR